MVAGWLKDRRNAAAFEVGDNLDTGEQYGFTVRKGNTKLLAPINKAIAEAKADGTYKKLYEKWIGPYLRVRGASASAASADGSRRPRPPLRGEPRYSRGAQYVVFVAVVVAFAVAADWGQLQNQFAAADLAKQLFPDDHHGRRCSNTVIYTLLGFVLGLVLGVVLALMRLSSVGPYRWLATALHRVLPRAAGPADLHPRRASACRWRSPAWRSPAAPTARWRSRSAWSRPPTWPRRSGPASRRCPRGSSRRPGRWACRTARAMRSIVIPQAFRIVIPPLTNELVLLFKDSSLVLFLGVTRRASS